MKGPLPHDDHDSETEVTLDVVKHRAIRGVAVITSRGFILNLIAQIAQLSLLAFLSPEELGVFWVVNSLVLLSTTFSDVGLAAALIQKKEKPSESDYRTTFTFQVVVVGIILIVIYALAPAIAQTYSLSREGIILVYALGIGLFLSYLKTIPSVLLERKLEFVKFVFPEIIENLVFYITVVYFASQGYGLISFVYGVLVRGVVGVVVIYILSPWKPMLSFSWKSFRELLKFGLPYQFNSIIANIKDRGMSAILGLFIGNAGVGYLGTAERISQLPLRFFMDSVTKVSFPAFSRMQDQKDLLARAVTKSIFFLTFLVYPSIIGLVLILPVFINVFPTYQKWAPALPALNFFVLSVIFAAVTTQLTNVLSAIGRITTVSKLMLMWAILTILIVPILANLYGVTGAALGYAIVSSSSIVAIYVAKKYINFSLMEGVGYTGIASIVMFIAVSLLRYIFPPTIINMVMMILVGGFIYLAIVYLFKGVELVSDAKKIFTSFRKK